MSEQPDSSSEPSPDQAPGSDALFDQLRATLSEERDALEVQVGELEVEETVDEFDDNFADSAQVAAEQGENRSLAASLREQLDDVEAALSRLDEGTYGRCEVCQNPIGDDRLEAMPATRWCIAHAG